VNDPEHNDPEQVDSLFAKALAAGESRSRAREVLAGTAADEQVLAAALRRAVPAAFLEEVAAARPWSERPRVLASVVLSPKAPQALSLRLVSGLYWRDLAEVAATPRVPAAVRSRAESLLRDGLGDMRLGDRITLARLATPSLLPALLADSERQVTESTLLNPRLREEDLVAALRREDARTVLVESTVASSRWASNYAVRLALVLQPRTPLAVALQQISSLVPRDLRRVAEEPGLRPLVRAAAQEVLAGRATG
jgi:hypothetical protein